VPRVRVRAAVESSDSLLVFPDPKGGMHTENINTNERIATALKRAGLLIGYDVCRTCKTRSRTTSATSPGATSAGTSSWSYPCPAPS
jgi:hypothetical protein